jgi:hypothetical protein
MVMTANAVAPANNTAKTAVTMTKMSLWEMNDLPTTIRWHTFYNTKHNYMSRQLDTRCYKCGIWSCTGHASDRFIDGMRKLRTIYPDITTSWHNTWHEQGSRLHSPDRRSDAFSVRRYRPKPMPRAGHKAVKFAKVRANEAEAVETVMLPRESGGWIMFGITVG